jgi:hypothetical protein
MVHTSLCRINVAEYLGAIFGLSVFMGLGWICILSSMGMLSLQSPGNSFVSVVLSVILTVATHEGTHASVARLLGAEKIKSGFFKYGAYVAIEEPLARDEWITVAAAPILISPLALVLATLTGGMLRDVLVFVSLINFVGSSGDIVLAIFASKTSRDTLIRDEGPAVVFEGRCPQATFANMVRALAPAGLALFLMLTLVLQVLLLAAQFSLPRPADKAIELLKNNETFTVDILGLVEAQVSLQKTPSGRAVSYSSKAKPAYFILSFLIAFLAAFAEWYYLKRQGKANGGQSIGLP